MTGVIETRLERLALALPPVHQPVANYVGAVVSGNQVWISGQGPTWGQEIRFRGKVGSELSLAQGHAAAQLACLNLLAQAKTAAGGDLERISGCIKLFGLVHSAAGFSDQHLVLNGASDLLAAVFDDGGRHARAAIAAPALPFSIAVELDAIFALRE